MRPALLALLLELAACGGRIAEEPAPPPSPPAPAAPDAGCEIATVDAWCSLVARGGVDVDPRADACCARWLEPGDYPPSP